jgi:hypothetical protein
MNEMEGSCFEIQMKNKIWKIINTKIYLIFRLHSMQKYNR